MYYLKSYTSNAKIYVRQLNKINNSAHKYFKIYLQYDKQQSELNEKLNQ